MKRIATAALALLLSFGTLHAAEEFSEVEYYQKLAAQKLADAQEPRATAQATPKPAYVQDMPSVYYEPTSCFDEVPPANAFIAFGQYFHSRNDNATFDMGGDKLKMRKSRANGAGVTLLYNRVFSDWLSVAFMYEYGFLNIDGGMAAPLVADDAYEHTRYNSHVLGILPEFKLGALGKLQLSYIQGFDRASGNETMVLGGEATTMDVDSYGTNVSSFMAWWEKDFDLGCSGWKLTPYAGWRSLYGVVKNQNDFANMARLDDSNTWVHLASGGLKASYQRENLGISLRAGINHRTSHDDVPGYGNRAVAPSVVHFSHRANLDKTVGTVGAGISYAINKRAIVGLQYDGYFGKDTSAHLGTMSFIFPF